MAGESPRSTRDAPSEEIAPAEQARIKTVTAWVVQLARTLKTCRLYDRNNPTVVQFRADLASSLGHLLGTHGRMELSFASADVLFQGASVYPARSRDDNLALAFYRDGIRSLSFEPGIAPQEVETLLDAVLDVTRHNAGDEDLVTLLWDADLEHVRVESVSTEGDVETGGEADEGDAGPVAPWPRQEPGADAGSGPAAPDQGEGPDREQDRSDDRVTGVETADLESAFDALDRVATREVERLRYEREREAEAPLARASLELMRASLRAAERPADRAGLGVLLPRVLHETFALGLWTEAREVLALVRQFAGPGWSVGGFAQELDQHASLTTRRAVQHLDEHDASGIEAFLDLALDLGPDAVSWLMRVLAESRQQRVRRPLTRTIAKLCRDNPERLAPWLADERWYVVRNVVHILGWIRGDAIVGLLRAASGHAEHRVRREVVAALAQVSPSASRTVLLEMLDSADSRLFGSILHQFAARRDSQVAHRLLAEFQDPRFGRRPDPERRAILLALGATAEDDVLPALEVELNAGHWFARGGDVRRCWLARCIARVGTPAARNVLVRGARSRDGTLGVVCVDALACFRPRT